MIGKKRIIWLAAVAVLALAIWFGGSLKGLESGQAQEDRRQLEEAIRRGAVVCYAAEGFYPPNIQYLTEHYGVQINGDLYTVFYEVVAENLMPEITVLEKES